MKDDLDWLNLLFVFLAQLLLIGFTIGLLFFYLDRVKSALKSV